MKINATTVCVSTLLLLMNLSFSKQSAAQQYRLQDLYQQAIKTYPGIKAKQENINAVTYEKKQVNTLQLPQVALQVQNTYGTFQSTTGSVFPMPGMFNTSGGNVDRSNGDAISTAYGSVVADWTFYSFGKIRQQKMAADHKIGTAEKELSAYELNLKSRITQLYFHNLYYHAKFEWALQNAERMQQILDISKSYAEAGLKPGADSLLVASAQSKIKGDVVKWKGKLQANEQQIEEFSQAPFSADNNSITAFLKNRPAPLVRDSVIPQHPYLTVIESQIDYFGALEKSASRAALPSAALLGGYSVRGSGIENGETTTDWSSAFDQPQNNYLIGVGIKWNLTDGYKSKLNKKRIQHEKYAVAADLEQKKLQLKSAINATQANLKQELLRINETEESVEKARAAYELYNTRYESGLLNLTELLQIQLILQESEKDRIDAYQELWDIARIQSENTGDFFNLFSIF